MTELDTLGEPDQLEELQLSAARGQHRLRESPGLVAWIRLQVTPGMGGASDGMPRAASKTPPAPMRVDAVDESDSIYAQLLNWVAYWADLFEETGPSTANVAWSNDREAQGFRAGVTPEGAGILVANLTTWLLVRQSKIMLHNTAVTFYDDVADIIWKARNRFPRAPRPPRDVTPRPCPVCDQFAIGAEWQSEDVRDVVVSCSECGYEIPRRSFQRVIEWIA